MAIFHDVLTPGQLNVIQNPTGQSVRFRLLNTSADNNKCRVALVTNYQAGQQPALDQYIEYDAGMLPDGYIDNTQLIMPSASALLVWVDAAAVLRLSGYSIADRLLAFFPSHIPAIGAFSRLCVAEKKIEVTLRCCNLEAAPVVATIYVCQPGYVAGAAPILGRRFAGNVTIPGSGVIDGGVFEETNILLDTGESIVIVSGGRLACRVYGINRF